MAGMWPRIRQAVVLPEKIIQQKHAVQLHSRKARNKNDHSGKNRSLESVKKTIVAFVTLSRCPD
jgi:hypothetical protein